MTLLSGFESNHLEADATILLFTKGDNVMQRFVRSNFSRKSILLLMVLALMLLPMTVFAQDPDEGETTAYTSSDGTLSFEYPESWSVSDDLIPPAIILTNGAIEDSYLYTEDAEDSVAVLILPSSGIAETFPEIEGDVPDSPTEAIEFMIENVVDDTEFDEIVEETINEYPAASVMYSGETNGEMFMLDLGDGDLFLVMGLTTSDDYDQHQDIIRSIVASMTFIQPEEGDFRTVSSPDLDLSFEMPFEYVSDDTEVPGAVLIGSSEDVFDTGPTEEDTLTAVIGTEQYFVEIFDAASDQFQTPELAIEAVAAMFVSEDLTDLTVSDVETVEVEDAAFSELLLLTFESEEFDGMIITFVLPDERVMIVFAGFNAGELDDFEDIILQIATSIQSLEAMESAEE